ncbi:hypothetical protein [Falsiroseomonas sp. E2-1-a4]|uniref:hypothetical protein n=1 Tax=Falsiroseomonas sp. E2-1-a4 TaxID=3239299 RepID=UPI003F5A6930
MKIALPTRLTGIMLTAGAALLASACTYAPQAPQQPSTIVVPQASPTVMAPAAPPTTVTVRPSY